MGRNKQILSWDWVLNHEKAKPISRRIHYACLEWDAREAAIPKESINYTPETFIELVLNESQSGKHYSERIYGLFSRKSADMGDCGVLHAHPNLSMIGDDADFRLGNTLIYHSSGQYSMEQMIMKFLLVRILKWQPEQSPYHEFVGFDFKKGYAMSFYIDDDMKSNELAEIYDQLRSFCDQVFDVEGQDLIIRSTTETVESETLQDRYDKLVKKVRKLIKNKNDGPQFAVCLTQLEELIKQESQS